MMARVKRAGNDGVGMAAGRKVAMSGLAAVFLLLVAVSSGAVAADTAVAESGRPVQASLDDLKAQSESRLPPEILEAGRKGLEEMIRAGITGKALNVGDAMPEFTLPDAHGRPVSSADLLQQGPVVLVFYRGAWCPFCNLYLHGLQERLPQFRARGASLVAVSGETPDNSLSVEEKNGLQFTVLSDPGLTASRRFGIVYAFLDPDYKKRAEPADTLEALDGLR